MSKPMAPYVGCSNQSSRQQMDPLQYQCCAEVRLQGPMRRFKKGLTGSGSDCIAWPYVLLHLGQH